MEAIAVILVLDAIALIGFLYFTIQDHKEAKQAKKAMQLKAE